MKKILVVSSWAPPVVGGPLNLYNLLSQMPKESYCLLTSYYGIDNYSARHGNWLEGKYIFYDNPRFIDSPESRPLVSTASKGRERISKLRHLVKRLSFLKILLGPALIFSQIFMIVRAGLKAVKNEKIEVMLGVSDFGPALIGTYFLHKLSKIPYALYLFDLYKGNNLFFPGRLLATLFEKPLFENAEKIIVTNEGTKEFYFKRYGDEINKKLVVIHNSVFPEPYLEFQKSLPPYRSTSPYTILFTGKIGWPQIGALKNLIKAINEIDDIDINPVRGPNRRFGRRQSRLTSNGVKLKIYTPSPADYLKEIGIEKSEKVEISVAPPSEMPKIQSQADILFLPLSWHTKSQEIIDTATPGKLTDYLIASRPILIHAPASSFLVKYAKENNFALVVDEENIEKLKKAIKTLLFDKRFAEQIIENAKTTFFRNHDANKNFKIFESLFLKN